MTTAPTTVQPGAGTPDADDPDEVLRRAAEGGALTAQEEDDLLDYWLSNGNLPGHGKPHPISLKLGVGTDAKVFKVKVRRVLWEEHQKSIELATSEDGKGIDGRLLAANNIAWGLLTPKLQPLFAKQLAEAKAAPDGKIDGPKGNRIAPPETIADLVLRIFADEPGAVLDLGDAILRLSKLSQFSERSVVEDTDLQVEAGKG